MARALALVPDLLFGSRLQSSLAAGGLDVELVAAAALRERLASAPAPELLVVDLTDAELDGPAIVESLAREGALASTRTLGFYAHVDAEARERAERAGFDLVVPRSRMAREGAQLAARLAGTAPPPGG